MAVAETPKTGVARGDTDISVVAPAYNESDNLTPLVKQLTEVLNGMAKSYEIIIVDDGSEDDTQETMYRLASLFDEVKCIQLKRNYGQSHALQAGIDAAGGEVIVTIDADLQNDPDDIPELVNALESESVDCVSGRRVDRQDSLAKTIPSRVQTRLAKRTGVDINDFGCTLKAYRADALADVNIYGEGHRYIPAMLYSKGHAVAEIDVNHRERGNGNSHYGLSRLVRGFVDLVWHWFWNRYGTRPLHLFGGLGLLFMAITGVVFGWLFVDRIVMGEPLGPHLPLLLSAGVAFLFGFVLFVFGVLAEMVTKLHYRDETPYRVRRVFK